MAILSADGPTAGMQDYDTSALPSHLIFFTALFRENPAQILVYISERLPYPLAKVLVTCLERDTFFKRPFPVTTCSASFRPPLPPSLSLSLWRSVSLPIPLSLHFPDPPPTAAHLFLLILPATHSYALAFAS